MNCLILSLLFALAVRSFLEFFLGGAEREVRWFAIFPMRIQDEYLTSIRKVLRRKAYAALARAKFRGGTGKFAHPRCYRRGCSACDQAI